MGRLGYQWDKYPDIALAFALAALLILAAGFLVIGLCAFVQFLRGREF